MNDRAPFRQLPLPSFYRREHADQAFRVPYQDRAEQARQWAQEHSLSPAAADTFTLALVAVDMQNTFCLPQFELYVGGRSGTGAVDDTRRLSEFVYRNLGSITKIFATLDTHLAMQIFHPVFLVDERGRHPNPYTLVSAGDVQSGRWRFNPATAEMLEIGEDYGQRHLEYYTQALKGNQKYELTVWPYHAMLGGLGHALVSTFEEAAFFHGLARYSQPDLQIKGDNPLTEAYSAVGPEVVQDAAGSPIAARSSRLLEAVQRYDAVVIAGEAKSHCVAWTIADLLADIKAVDPDLASKVYLLEDCTSPVVVPGAIDYTDQADAEFQRFAEAGMHVVRSTEPIDSWPGIHSR